MRQKNTRREQVRVVVSANTSTTNKDNSAVQDAVQQMQSRQAAVEQQFAQTQQAVSQMQSMLQQFMYSNGVAQSEKHLPGGSQTHVTTRNEPRRGRCYNCNEPGHHSRACLYRQVGSTPVCSQTSNQTGEHESNNRAITRRMRSARTAYLSVTV